MKKRSYTRQHIDWSDAEQVRAYKRKLYKNDWRRNMRKRCAGTVLGVRVQTNLVRKSQRAELEIAR